MPFNKTSIVPGASDIGIRLYCQLTDLDEKSLWLNCAGIITVRWSTNSFPLPAGGIPSLADCPLSIDSNTFLFVEAIGSVDSPVMRHAEVGGGHATVRASFRVETTGFYDWSRFPRDRQLIILRLQLRPTHPSNVPVQYARLGQSRFQFRGVMAEEWEPWDTKPMLRTYQRRVNGRPQWVVMLRIQRKSKSYIVQVVFPVTLLGFVLASVFVTPLHDVTAKLSLIITLLLAAGAYQITVSNYLPVLDYSTDLGWFVLLSFSLYAVAIVFLFILYARGYFHHDASDGDDRIERLQWAFFGSLGSLQLLFALVVVLAKGELG